ncbi:MAG: glycosyltransferase [Candidatus Omnitrophica bacterium]|nr:glycosyltransferase [Candidatus Omnitrophota bacterium]
MKICMIFPTYPPNYQVDGIGDYTRILVSKLRQRGHEVFVITSGRYAGNDPRVIKIGGGKWGIRELVRVFRLIRRDGFQVVHMQYTPISYGYGLTFKLLPLLIRLSAHRIHFIVTFHTLVAGRWISRINALLLVMFSHKVISTHEELTQLYQKWLFPFSKKLVQIPIGTNIEPVEVDGERIREEINKKYGISKNATLLVNFGFPNPWKGLETLCEAVKILSREGDYRLIIMGGLTDRGIEYRYEIKGFIRRLGIEKEVIWMDGLKEKDVSGVLQASDIAVFPFVDGISIRRGTLMAAMAHGLPIVSTRPRVKCPYFRNGENVMLVGPGDKVALAEAIRKLSKDRELRDRLSMNVKALSLGFDWDRIAGSMIKVYSEFD